MFTLEGAEHAYRVLIESMNEGALTLTADKTILYANQCFASMVKCPLEQVTGSSFRRFLSAEDRATLRPLLKRAGKSGSKIQVLLKAGDGSHLPAHISIRPLPKNGSNSADLRHGGDRHDAKPGATKKCCGPCRTAWCKRRKPSAGAWPSNCTTTSPSCSAPSSFAARRWRTTFRRASRVCAERGGETPRHGSAKWPKKWSASRAICGPAFWSNWAWPPSLRDASKEFSDRTGVPVKLACVPLTARLPADTELTLYRILQEALKNVEKHARARHVTVRLTLQEASFNS